MRQFIRDLQQAGIIRPMKAKASGTGRKPSPSYEVNPHLFSRALTKPTKPTKRQAGGREPGGDDLGIGGTP
jgi:hypothetical protein